MSKIRFLLPLLLISLLSGKTVSSIYKNKCANCHGSHGEIKALGQAKALNTMTVDEIAKGIQAISAGEKKTIPMIKKAKLDLIRCDAKSCNPKKDIHDMALYIHSLK